MATGVMQSAAERAERYARKRTRILWMEFALFVVWQGGFVFLLKPPVSAMRAVDWVEQAAWLLWAVVLLALIGTGGAFFQSAEIRGLMNDDVSTANRHEGQRWGFWAAMATVVALYVAALIWPISLTIAIHAVLTLGIGGALWRFAWLERRADRAG
jgi:hypothetical protein